MIILGPEASILKTAKLESKNRTIRRAALIKKAVLESKAVVKRHYLQDRKQEKTKMNFRKETIKEKKRKSVNTIV